MKGISPRTGIFKGANPATDFTVPCNSVLNNNDERQLEHGQSDTADTLSSFECNTDQRHDQSHEITITAAAAIPKNKLPV
jgi:hypothetical protein